MNQPSSLLIALIVSLLVGGCATGAARGPVAPQARKELRGGRSSPLPDTFNDLTHRLPDQHLLPAVVSVPTIEAVDEDLRAVLRKIEKAPASDAHRQAAFEYRRLQVFDRALDHLDAALELDPRDAQSFESRARLWRDHGLPGEGLGDAYRAAFFAPASASSHNTLGTVLHRLGHYAGARVHYETALRLDPTAAYALNNICALELAEGHATRARVACERALRLDPALEPASVNLHTATRLGATDARRNRD